MNTPWSLAELTEFDARLHASRGMESVSSISACDASTPKPAVLKQWLVHSRQLDPEPARLASVAVQSEAWLRLSLGLFSVLSGCGAAVALLRYEGYRLINISAFLGILVGGQLLSLLVLAVSFFWLRHRLSHLQKLFLPKLVRELTAPESLPAWRWRLFTSFQQAGMLFNLGILLAALWKVLTADLAFGWATTLDVTGQGIHRIVQTLALPWGGRFAPDLTQIQQSRILLKDGLAHIDAASTAAWWPFLLLCVLTYGFLPRLLLALFGRLRVHRLERHPAFSSPESERLYQRLTRQTLVFSTSREDVSRPNSSASPPDLPPLEPAGPLSLALPPDILPETRKPAFRNRIQSSFGVSLADSPEASSGILKVIEAWQPPLEESLRELRELRKQAGPNQDLLILAVGLPNPIEPHFFHPPEPADLDIWRQKLSTLRDPRLGLLPWRETSS
ncbi:MAG: DUF2868 domain-containing protein [Kiritimatiellae bacterium]|nr:DUF2868 domain-containing protein [Kiritimatiellia bacterium]